MSEPRPWRRALAWLAFLGPFFYASYGLANALASGRAAVPTLAFAWEAQIPFLAWTILPYWSLNLFYAGSPFLFRAARELDAHGRRLLLAQVLAVACFLLWPLRFGFERPAAEGWTGALFAALMSFDQPFNQAPSLHIALLLILWQPYAQRLRGLARWALHAWFGLIGVSVLTTFQHHAIDIPAGAALGLLCMVMIPLQGAPWPWRRGCDPAGARLAWRFGLAAAVCLAAALALLHLGLQAGAWAGAGLGLAGVLLAWGALALVVVALVYRSGQARAFGKAEGGRSPWPLALLLAPYRLGAWLNSRWHTRGGQARSEVWPGVWLSRLPSRRELARARPAALIDAVPELPLPHPQALRLPLLDLLVPAPAALRLGAEAIEAAHRRGAGAIWVCCALGYARSAALVATWLLRSGRARDAAAAATLLRQARPGVRLSPAHWQAIEAAARP